MRMRPYQTKRSAVSHTFTPPPHLPLSVQISGQYDQERQFGGGGGHGAGGFPGGGFPGGGFPGGGFPGGMNFNFGGGGGHHSDTAHNPEQLFGTSKHLVSITDDHKSLRSPTTVRYAQ